MSQEIVNANPAAVNDLQNLEIETFQVEELDQLDVDASEVKISLCSSTTSSSCG